MSTITTPADVERRLLELSTALDEAQGDLEDAEFDYWRTKADYEIAVARKTVELVYEPTKRTVDQRAAEVTIAVEDQYRAFGAASARQRAARGNIDRLRAQVDIARSLGTSVRSAIEIV